MDPLVAIPWVYGVFATVAVSNLLLMRRPRREPPPASPIEPQSLSAIVLLIPARDEAANLPRLLASVPKSVRVIVVDDASTDGTGDIARAWGAEVITTDAPLPGGWTGKNWACHRLAQAALQDLGGADWLVYVDADTEFIGDGLARIASELATVRPGVGVISGIPHVAPGRGFEPLVSAWVGWIVLATNPFGLVARTGLGHNFFLNGQFQAWRPEVYRATSPHESVRHRIMEDVAMGRLLAARRIPVEVWNLSAVLTVRMYRNAREAWNGFSKNAYEITNSVAGNVFLVSFLALVAAGWTYGPPASAPLLFTSGLAVVLATRAAFWPLLFLPIALLIGSATVIRSVFWRMTGRTSWKGRTYSTR
ncbi:MAG: glycosyltransferase family 2 protein [Fimbriimonadaceae bacterium]|nr:glycosyltransferase family 2 protein [Fimbriimonadaceae bacterium]